MKTIAAILMFASLAGAALADTPEVDATYFHPAASLYIQGDAVAASNLVVKGLAEYPGDSKLKALQELLEKQQQQQKQDQDKQDQQKKDPQKNQDKTKDSQDPQKQGEQQNQQDGQQNDPQQPPQPKSAEEMSPEEAKRLLDAMKQEEKNKRMQLHPVLGRPVKVDKDW